MNREEVEKYIQEAVTIKLDGIKESSYTNWILKYKKHFELFPKKLYKYVFLNNYYIDAINNDYIYLCPAKKLDDQFECRVDFPIQKILKNRKIIDEKFIEALADKVSDYPSCFDKKKDERNN